MSRLVESNSKPPMVLILEKLLNLAHDNKELSYQVFVVWAALYPRSDKNSTRKTRMSYGIIAVI